MAKSSGTMVGRRSSSPVSERAFASATGIGFGHPVSAYEQLYATIRDTPDNETLFTGHEAGEVKKLLRRMIKTLGGNVNVQFSDIFE